MNVTNVYQTVVQAGPATALAVARPAAAHEGSSSLACLEQSLRVKSGSIARPASRWRHAPKVAAVHATTPQAVGMLQCGTMLVPALSADAHVGGRPHDGELETGQAGCLSGLRPPLRSHEAPGCVGMPSDAATACTTIAVAAQAGDITIPIDLFDWEAPVASPPQPSMHPCVAAAMAFAAVTRQPAAVAPPPTVTTCSTPAAPIPLLLLSDCTTPEPNIVQAALAFAAGQAAEAGAGRTAAIVSARAHALARAKVLQRAGMHDEAMALVVSAGPPPPVPPPLMPAVGAVTSLRPAPRPRKQRLSTIAVDAPTRDASSMLAVSGERMQWAAWALLHVGSQVPPAADSGVELTPAQVATQGVFDMPPGARRARVAALAAAARIVPFMSLSQVSTLLGCPISHLRARDTALVAADVVHVVGFGWAAGTIDSGRNTWLRLVEFAQRGGHLAGSHDTAYLYGYVVRQFLDTVDRVAQAAWRKRNPDADASTVSARGRKAIGGQATSCLWLAAKLSFPIQMDSVSVKLVLKNARRAPGSNKQAEALGPRFIYILCWLTMHGESEFIRCHAGAWVAMVMFATRHANAQRASLHSCVDCVVRLWCVRPRC